MAPFVHLLDGLLSDQQPVLIRDQAELVRYAYHVAGAVGLLMCPVLGCRDPAAFRFAVDMGIGMQLTNIARDIAEDAELGRRYLPESWCGPLRPEQISLFNRAGHTDIKRFRQPQTNCSCWLIPIMKAGAGAWPGCPGGPERESLLQAAFIRKSATKPAGQA